MSKVIEKCAISQLDSYMNAENMHELHQSAYRVGHSTETALTRIQHDIACELDQSRGVIPAAASDLPSPCRPSHRSCAPPSGTRAGRNH